MDEQLKSIINQWLIKAEPEVEEAQEALTAARDVREFVLARIEI